MFSDPPDVRMKIAIADTVTRWGSIEGTMSQTMDIALDLERHGIPFPRIGQFDAREFSRKRAQWYRFSKHVLRRDENWLSGLEKLNDQISKARFMRDALCHGCPTLRAKDNAITCSMRSDKEEYRRMQFDKTVQVFSAIPEMLPLDKSYLREHLKKFRRYDIEYSLHDLETMAILTMPDLNMSVMDFHFAVLKASLEEIKQKLGEF
jgi:hypothetical protein